jgi:hypothetical protein
MNHGLALDFFHLAPHETPLRADLTKFIERVIAERHYIDPSDEATLPRISGNATLQEWRPGQFCLRFEASDNFDALIYTLTYKVYRHLQGNIFGLSAHARPGKAYVSVYHSLPPALTPAAAQAIVANHF